MAVDGMIETEIECVYRYKLRTFSDVPHMIDDYIYLNNNERVQTKTGVVPLT